MSRVLLTVFFSGVLVAMLWVTLTASLDRDVVTAARELWSDPWGKATLFDAYFAFLAVYLWMAWRERSALARVVWLVLVLTLGNFAIATYVLLALWRRPLATVENALFERPAPPPEGGAA